MLLNNEISVVIADDHPMTLKGLKDEFLESSYNVVGEAINGMQALELILTLEPTIALLDIEMPILTGFEVIKMVKQKELKTKFIVLSFHKEKEYISQAKALQINGYLLKEDSFAVIENCIKNILNDKICFSPSFEASSLESVSEEFKLIKLLTPSEKTILKLIAQQMSSNEIAETLFISPRTVEKHRSNILAKLEIDNSNNALINWAFIHRKTLKEI